MNILILNAGSSSLKFSLFAFPSGRRLARGVIERIGEGESPVHIFYDQHRAEYRESVTDHREALEYLERLLPRLGILERFDSLSAVGHRVVHGGERFVEPTRIDEEVIEAIRSLVPLAPLHNPANLLGIEAMRALAPGVPQVAVFDTAFHRTVPPEGYRYAVPDEWYERYGVRRYGFHGISHAYVSREYARLRDVTLKNINMITLHLGNGASACAVAGGESVATSMGMTPLEGLVMGTRSGDLDPGIHFYMHRYVGLDPAQIDRILNHESGLKGLCGTNDMREIERRMGEGDPAAKRAFDIFVRRLIRYVGGYAALLGRLDAIVFTGGIGEHSAAVREAVAEGLGILGVRIDGEANRSSDTGSRPIHAAKSAVELWVIPTDEERQIARETYRLLS